MIVIVNGEGRVVYASPSVAKIMGYEEDDWQSLDVLSIVHPDQLEEAAVSFDILKIDKSFIDQSASSEREGVLARAIVELGRTFSVEVVAEGIEDERGLERLRG
jgi:PAS domain S-box-containing protein